MLQVHRVIQRLGYALYRLNKKRVLDGASKRKRTEWAQEHAGRRPVWWQNRAYADAHYWYLPRSRAEAAATTSQKAIYRKKSEGKMPKFHGGRGAGYQQVSHHRQQPPSLAPGMHQHHNQPMYHGMQHERIAQKLAPHVVHASFCPTYAEKQMAKCAAPAS